MAAELVQHVNDDPMCKGVFGFACGEGLGVLQGFRELILLKRVENNFVLIWHEANISNGTPYQGVEPIGKD
jgi:hypothetical protein